MSSFFVSGFGQGTCFVLVHLSINKYLNGAFIVTKTSQNRNF